MTAKVKSALSILSEALETAAGYALVAVALYAILFVDMTGGGSLWNSLKHLQSTANEEISSPNATRVVKVPTQAVAEKVHEDRILAVFDEAPSGSVAAVYQAPESIVSRPSAALTDTPADVHAGKTWKRDIKGSLRSFTVYGHGDQTASAVMNAPSVYTGSEPTGTPGVRSTQGSPARAETAAASRPGMGTRLSRGALAASETSRNAR